MNRLFFIACCSIILLVGCNGISQQSIADQLDWQESLEEAISSGLEEEGLSYDNILSIELYEGNTFLFFERNRSIGVASIEESERGYAWFRSNNFLGFYGDVEYSVLSTTVKTINEEEIEVLFGRVMSSDIQAVEVDGSRVWEKDHAKSNFFYAIINRPLNGVEVSVLKE